MLVGVKGATSKYSSIFKNEVFIRADGVIYKSFRGDQTCESIKRSREETEKLIQELRAQKKPVPMLVDLSALGKTTLSARNEEIETIRSLNFDKAAVFGQNFTNRKLAEIIVTFSGMEYKIKFFNSELEAYNWLADN